MYPYFQVGEFKRNMLNVWCAAHSAHFLCGEIIERRRSSARAREIISSIGDEVVLANSLNLFEREERRREFRLFGFFGDSYIARKAVTPYFVDVELDGENVLEKFANALKTAREPRVFDKRYAKRARDAFEDWHCSAGGLYERGYSGRCEIYRGMMEQAVEVG